MNIARVFSLVLLTSIPFLNASADTIPSIWDHEPVDHPGDPIPHAEVIRCVESGAGYEVDGVTFSADTIWITDPNGISITENTTLQHDYVFVGNGFRLMGAGITLDGNNHLVEFGTENHGEGVSIYNRTGNTVENIQVVKNTMIGNYNVGIHCYNSPYSIITDCTVTMTGMTPFGIISGHSSDGSAVIGNTVSVISTLFAIGVTGSSDQVLYELNTISAYGGNVTGLTLQGGENNYITNNTIHSDANAIELENAPEYTVIESNTIDAEEYDIRIESFVDNVLLLDQPIDGFHIVNSNFQIENSSYGQLNYIFNYSGQPRRITANGSNLDDVILISNNSIGVDTLTAHEGLLTQPATLVFYEPVIEGYPPYFPMMNASPCPDSIYSNFQQSGDTLFSFDVTHMALEFSIGGTPNTIDILEPSTSTVWHKEAETRTISWEYPGTSPGGDVSIDLYKDYEHITALSSATPNDGSWLFSYELPGSWESGGDYRVLIVDNEEDQGWSEEFSIDMETGIEGSGESDLPYILPINPNPNTGTLSLCYYLPSTMTVNLGVFDVSGRLLMSEDTEDQVSGLHQYGVSELPSGVYIFQMEAEGIMDTARFVVLR